MKPAVLNSNTVLNDRFKTVYKGADRMKKNKKQPPLPTTDNISIGEPEPWEKWETKLVCFSLILGVGMLIIGGILVNMFIL